MGEGGEEESMSRGSVVVEVCFLASRLLPFVSYVLYAYLVFVKEELGKLEEEKRG